MMMHFKTLEDISTAVYCPFRSKFPLAVPKSAVKSTKNAPVTLDFILCEVLGCVLRALTPPIFFV